MVWDSAQEQDALVIAFHQMGQRAVLRGLLLLIALLFLAQSAAAAASVGQLSKRLRKASDFRVRAQAALALGATGSSRALKPLCRSLYDSSRTVRAASAAALGRLRKPAGSACLKKRLAKEKVAIRSINHSSRTEKDRAGQCR